ncbi:MAG: 3-phosphoshikimate 1-carboxyvinyltransferase [Chlorobiota bacterium]|nr:3-phosphoshikimate 1-carboxyvinyltransferase [Chlorobiota bacterium]QQS65602.1 MAG: 3-phosphoshikimate 1-carboxyvinyltransferase [Chlorobiota bacterium]
MNIKLFPFLKPIKKTFHPPSDKSITHRALFFGAVNKGRTIIKYPLISGDTKSTINVLKKLGIKIILIGNYLIVDNKNNFVSHEEYIELDCGNSGTTARLLCGYISTRNGNFVITGDESLTTRPMKRVVDPLKKLGINIRSTNNSLPIYIENSSLTKYENILSTFDVSSAQVYTSLVLSSLYTNCKIQIFRTKPMRNHTELMLKNFDINVEKIKSDNVEYDLISPKIISGNYSINVCGDPSSAAFLIALGLLVKGSDIYIENVNVNPTRITFVNVLIKMGADISIINTYVVSNELIGSIHVKYTENLNGIVLNDSNKVSEMLDEIPIFSLIATQAKGTTKIEDVGELRFKESDRIKSIVELFKSLGVTIIELSNGLKIEGDQTILGGVVESNNDHRIVMTAAVASSIAINGIEIKDSHIAEVSYPNFFDIFKNYD